MNSNIINSKCQHDKIKIKINSTFKKNLRSEDEIDVQYIFHVMSRKAKMRRKKLISENGNEKRKENVPSAEVQMSRTKNINRERKTYEKQY